MDSLEFSAIRKRLEKTQKELAELLGTSLKAICSYEQGWRNIPTHVERQLLFLLTRKAGGSTRNCWDILRCPAETKKQCPAWEFKSGTLCWFINGTICRCQRRKSWNDKIAVCRTCPVLKEQLEF